MRLSGAIFTAFSAYSKIPMPQRPFDEENLRLSLAFFPLVGAAVGAAFFAVFYLAGRLALSPLLTGALLTAVPLLVTGGIHMDGYVDTVDALSSNKPRDEQLKIMSDPHIGAFGAMFLSLYLLVQAGVLSSALTHAQALVIALAFVLSRALSAFLLLTMPGAKESGMLRAFKDASAKRTVVRALCVVIALACAGMIIVRPPCGVCAVACAAVVAFFYRRMAMRRFGGATGDLAGFFLQLCELFMMLAVVCT